MRSFSFDGRQILITGEQSIAAALIQAGEPPRYFCGIGVCFACVVTVNGKPGQRACLVIARPGDEVKS